MQSPSYTYETVNTRQGYHAEPGAFAHDGRDLVKCRVIVGYALRSGGATITRGYDPIVPDGRYIAGGKYPGITRDATLPLDVLARDVERYVGQSPSYIVPTYVGLLVNDGALHIDTVTAHDDHNDAFDVARKCHQVAIHDSMLSLDYKVPYLPWHIEPGSVRDAATGETLPDSVLWEIAGMPAYNIVRHDGGDTIITCPTYLEIESHYRVRLA